LTELDKSIDTGAQFLAALKSRTVLAVPTLEDYEQQLATLTRNRDQMREVVTRWGTLIEEFPTPGEPHSTSQAYTAIAAHFLDAVRTCKREARLAQAGRTQPGTPTLRSP
jgi:hypothetical protein